MNYYEHHIRDYDTDTAHLTWEEDLAYTRLLRYYYRKEQPIPVDVKEACRFVRARTKAQRCAVASVLREFFVLCDDGWHNATCDSVIADFQDGEPEREARKKNEETRLFRYRKERSELFALINEAGLHLPWNAPIGEVRQLAERIRLQNATAGKDNSETLKAGPATAPVALPVTPVTAPATPVTAPATPATATHTPLPRHQTPEGKQSSSTAQPLSRDETVDALATIPDPPTNPGHWLQWFNASHGLSLDPLSPFDRKKFWPLATQWCKAGITVDQMVQAVAKARSEASEPIAYLPSYVDRVLASLAIPPPTLSASADSTLAAARAIFGEEIEAQHGHNRRIIDITPGAFGGDSETDLPRLAGELRCAFPESMEDRAEA